MLWSKFNSGWSLYASILLCSAIITATNQNFEIQKIVHLNNGTKKTDNFTINYTSLNQLYENWCNGSTNTSFLFSRDFLESMHFDLCADTPGYFAMPAYSNKTILIAKHNISLGISCNQLRERVQMDSAVGKNYTMFDSVLDRTEHDCSRDNCTQCLVSYKRWLCSSLLLAANGKRLHACSSYEADVCLSCPVFDADESYGGYPLFSCVVNKYEESCLDINFELT